MKGSLGCSVVGEGTQELPEHGHSIHLGLKMSCITGGLASPLSKPKLRKGLWLPEEDDKLVDEKWPGLLE